MLMPPPRSTLFPYTTLFRSRAAMLAMAELVPCDLIGVGVADATGFLERALDLPSCEVWEPDPQEGRSDRKSTRLNSSHVEISYAVFCLKKKKMIIPANCLIV